jgi:predicted CXXCH cytochrome family protein
VQEGQCASCHQPHGAAHAALLAKTHPSRFYVAFEDSRYELCFDCHDSDAFAEAITEDGTNFRNGTQNLHHAHVHRTKGRNCRVCHDPHASAHGKLIATSVPFGRWKIPLNFRETPTGGSCQPGCHRAYRYDRDSPIANLDPR